MQKNLRRTSLNKAKPASQKVILTGNSCVKVYHELFKLSGKGRYSRECNSNVADGKGYYFLLLTLSSSYELSVMWTMLKIV